MKPSEALVDSGGLAEDLHALIGVRVDVVTLNALHRRIRKRVLDEAKPV
jgi:predicted nucleotidyltransferase